MDIKATIDAYAETYANYMRWQERSAQIAAGRLALDKQGNPRRAASRHNIAMDIHQWQEEENTTFRQRANDERKLSLDQAASMGSLETLQFMSRLNEARENLADAVKIVKENAIISTAQQLRAGKLDWLLTPLDKTSAEFNFGDLHQRQLRPVLSIEELLKPLLNMEQDGKKAKLHDGKQNLARAPSADINV